MTKERYLQALLAELQAAYGEPEDVGIETGGEYQRWLREEKPLLVEEIETQLAEMAAFMDAQELADLRRSMEETIEATDSAIRAMDAELAGMGDEVSQAGDIQSGEIEEVQRQLATLSNGQQGRLPACVSDDPFSAGPEQCRDGTMIVEFAPDFFDDAASSADLKLIRVSPGIGNLGRFRSESQQAFEQRIGIYRAIDLDLLQSLID